MFAALEVHRHIVVVETLEVERDPDTVASGVPKVVVELHLG